MIILLFSTKSCKKGNSILGTIPKPDCKYSSLPVSLIDNELERLKFSIVVPDLSP